MRLQQLFRTRRLLFTTTMATASSSPSASVTPKQSSLKNRMFLIRHGRAESNDKRIFISKPEIGMNQYGLTDTGKQQAEEAASNFKSVLASEANLADRLLIVSSDFKRARETAEILHSNLLVKEPIRFESNLRERWFGSLDTKNVDTHCPQIWALDEADPTHNEYGIESIMEIVFRMSQTIQKLDKDYCERIIIMVSHGDPCQCIYSVFMGISPNEYRKHDGIQNCEIRELKEK